MVFEVVVFPVELELVTLDVEFEDEPLSTVILLLSTASKESCIVALASRSRNTVAEARLSSACTPRLRLGIKCAVRDPVDLTEGVRERVRAGTEGKYQYRAIINEANAVKNTHECHQH